MNNCLLVVVWERPLPPGTVLTWTRSGGAFQPNWLRARGRPHTPKPVVSATPSSPTPQAPTPPLPLRARPGWCPKAGQAGAPPAHSCRAPGPRSVPWITALPPAEGQPRWRRALTKRPKPPPAPQPAGRGGRRGGGGSPSPSRQG